ncbi:MAG: hypothetical protein GY703_00030 [Gammaproteobacteria bacterium]|nr:hypothetical protein [Gammaproteobacteria bacterium]
MTILQSQTFLRCFPVLVALIFCLGTSGVVFGQTLDVTNETPLDKDTLDTLESFSKIRLSLLMDIKALNEQIGNAQSEVEKERLLKEMGRLRADLRAAKQNFENIAAGIDISNLRTQEQQVFDLQKEILALLRPALDEMKEMTSHVRQKSDLKEKIAYYEERLPVLEQAIENISRIQEDSDNTPYAESLNETAAAWKKQYTFMQTDLQALNLQLDKLLASEVSITEASQSYLKTFFQKRGLFLTEAILVVLGIILLSRFSRSLMHRFMPGFRKKHRSFRIRLLELAHRIVTTLLLILGPMVVFYIAEDWVLFSLGILLLLGIGWTLRQALPRYWHQIQLFLNIGSVREGERIFMEGLPWMVEQINVYCTLINPTAGISQRVPIDEMVDLKSRPCRPEEPWFPCKKDDWVILSDGVRGKVTGISHELVSLVERGGAQLTYQTSDFLANSPRNLATNFRIKEILGISYTLQEHSTQSIPGILDRYIQQRLAQEGYSDDLLNLRVEFAQANSSSLDLVVIADFRGELGPLYNRLRRAIQRWCVDASTENDWEIPFPQMTLHGSVASAGQSEG